MAVTALTCAGWVIFFLLLNIRNSSRCNVFSIKLRASCLWLCFIDATADTTCCAQLTNKFFSNFLLKFSWLRQSTTKKMSDTTKTVTKVSEKKNKKLYHFLNGIPLSIEKKILKKKWSVWYNDSWIWKSLHYVDIITTANCVGCMHYYKIKSSMIFIEWRTKKFLWWPWDNLNVEWYF